MRVLSRVLLACVIGGGAAAPGLVFGAEKQAAPAKAKADFTAVEDLARDDAGFAVQLYQMAGQKFLNRNQPAQAVAAYRQALQLAPGDLQIIEELADAEAAAGKPKEALALWEETAAAHPADLGVRLRYANFLAKTGESDQAVQMMRELSGQRSEDSSLRYWIVDAYARSGKTAAAVRELQGMLKAFPKEGAEVKRRIGLLQPVSAAAESKESNVSTGSSQTQ